MAKIQQSGQESAIDMRTIQHLNPEEEQVRCRICYEQKLPLVALCQCTGSIAYCHEDCILDWIAMKMERSELIQIPKCQICKSPYAATMKIGSKKIDNALFFEKLKKATMRTWLDFVVLSLGMLVSFIMILVGVFHCFSGSGLIFESLWTVISSFFTTSFTEFIIPGYFIHNGLKFMKQKWKMIQDCKMQLVEVTLQPKKILKEEPYRKHNSSSLK